VRLTFASGLVFLFTGCATVSGPQVTRITGESFIFVGEEPSPLAFPCAAGAPVTLRASYVAGGLTYEEGRDFAVDHAAGTMRRLPGSRLPDFRSNVLHGLAEFDHTRHPGFGNRAFLAYADYAPAAPPRWPVQASQVHLLPRSRTRLAAGGPFRIVAFGDSITAGADVSGRDLVYWRRWTDALRAKYPRAVITAVDGATGGDTTTRGLERLQAKVLEASPDLVLVAFGMNDHNRRGVAPEVFERQLVEIITRIRAATSAEVVLVSAFPPNPRWVHGSGRMTAYAEATARAATGAGCAYADVFSNWQAFAARKRPEDLLANNINHPSDFGHWIYFRVLEEMGL
jgi:lysophospholipase L1-like esterase